MSRTINERFDRLLKAMLAGPAPSARRSASSGQASGEEQYSPPENPTKVSDSRAADYIERFGYSCWELDALEPKVLDDLIANEIRSFIDDDVWQETKREQDERRETLSKLHENWDEVSEFVSTL